MTLKLHFLRHGQTAMSREDLFCGSGLDPELTVEGREMAVAFAAASRDKPWTAIYSSGLQRDHDGTQPLCEALGLS